MKVYRQKFQKPNRYKQNLQSIAKISNYQPIPSIPQISDDFNFTFLNKDYDEANPFLKKNSFRKVVKKNEQDQEGNSSFQQSLMLFSPISKSKNNLVEKREKSNFNQEFKLPSINKKQRLKGNQDYKVSKIKNNNQSENEKSIKYNKSATIDTRINTRVETDQISHLQETSSAASILKIQSKTKSHPILEAQWQQSSLVISKLSDPNIINKNWNFIERYNLQSRDLDDNSRISSLASKNQSYKYENPEMIQQQQSTGSQTEEEFVKDSVPGPGYYSITYQSNSSRRTSKSINFNFGSNSMRFSSANKLDSQYDDKLLEDYQKKQKLREQKLIKLNKKQKKLVPFNSSEEKSLLEKQSAQINKFISPVYYNPRYGIQEQLIRKIQRNFKGSFGVAEKRFRTIYKKTPNLGPGSYSVEFKKDQDQQKKQDHIFASKIERFK